MRADSEEEAETMVTDWDCFSKGKKEKYRDLLRKCEPDRSGSGKGSGNLKCRLYFLECLPPGKEQEFQLGSGFG